MAQEDRAAPTRADTDAPGGADAALSDVALFTVSHAGDLAMCRRLCASIDRHMPAVTHYLAVDCVDRPLFEPFVRQGRILLETERYMPGVRQTTLLGRRVWLTAYGPPLRGWIYQQLVKLAVVATLDAAAVVIVDSDAEFIRPLSRERLLRDGRTRLWRDPGQTPPAAHAPWFRTAGRVLGVPPQDHYGAEFITTAVTWRPSVVRALLARIVKTTRLPWRMALSWRFRFSEYVLYGVFAEAAPGPHQDELFRDENDLCHCSWHYDLAAEEGRRAFVDGLRPHHDAILVQSNLRLPTADRDALLARFEGVAAG